MRLKKTHVSVIRTWLKKDPAHLAKLGKKGRGLGDIETGWNGGEVNDARFVLRLFLLALFQGSITCGQLRKAVE